MAGNILAPPQGDFKNGGEGGIRTLDTLPYTHFPGVRLRPLGHLSVGADSSTVALPLNRSPRLKRDPQL